jgi:hypothetical protein
MAEEVLTRRALNRALLERQLLLHRARRPVAEAVELLLGLQAQSPLPPYYGLWSRLEGFDPHELGRMLTDREAVRLTTMRGTVHLHTVRDALWLRPLVQPAIERSSGAWRRRLDGVDPAALLPAVRELLAAGPLTAREIGARLLQRGIGDDAEALAHACRVQLALVQVPPRGVWGSGGQARYATIESWTGGELDAAAEMEELVLRYLRGFGPASVMDAQTWSGLTRLSAVFDRLRPRLATFRNEAGRELFDLPDAPRPDPGVPAPVRLLGEYDNVLLGHADRSRIIPEGLRWSGMLIDERHMSNVLVDGELRALWWLERDGARQAILAVRPFARLGAAVRREIEAEAQRMLGFAAAGAAARDVRFDAPAG